MRGLVIRPSSYLLIGTAEPWDASLPMGSISWMVIAFLSGGQREPGGASLPAGYALGQMTSSTRTIHKTAFGALSWLYIASNSATLVLGTLTVVPAVITFKPPKRYV